jgi:hypothetical protein
LFASTNIGECGIPALVETQDSWKKLSSRTKRWSEDLNIKKCYILFYKIDEKFEKWNRKRSSPRSANGLHSVAKLWKKWQRNGHSVSSEWSNSALYSASSNSGSGAKIVEKTGKRKWLLLVFIIVVLYPN